LGGIDKSYATSDFEYHDLISETYWMVNLNQVFIGGNALFDGETTTAIVDSGTTAITF